MLSCVIVHNSYQSLCSSTQLLKDKHAKMITENDSHKRNLVVFGIFAYFKSD